MKKKYKIIAVFMIITLMAFPLFSCTTYDSFANFLMNEDSEIIDTIKVGVYQPITGAESANAQFEIDGIELAHEYVTEVLGKDIELIYGDTKSDVNNVDAVIADLVAKGVDVIIGSYGDIYTIAASNAISEQQIPAFAISPSNPLISRNNDYYFRMSIAEEYQAQALSEFAYTQLLAQNIGIVRIEGEDTGSMYSTSFIDNAITINNVQEDSIQIIDLNPNTLEYEKALMPLLITEVNTIFMPIDSPEVVNDVLEAAESIGLKDVNIISLESWRTDEFITVLNEFPAYDVFISSSYNANRLLSEVSVDFQKYYNDKYGAAENIQTETALAFDAYLLAVNAIAKCGSTDGPLLRYTIQHTENFEGASGTFSFDSEGNAFKTIYIEELINGEFKSTTTLEQSEDTVVETQLVLE